MRTAKLLSKRLPRVCLALVLAPILSRVSVDAQVPVTSTLSRYNVERYFADSLRAGTQRVIDATGSVGRVPLTGTLSRGAFLPTRVPGGAVVQPTVSGDDTRIVLPDRAFAETGGGVGMLLIPVVVIEGGGLRFQDGSFRGSIRVGVEDSLQSASSVGLSTPIHFFVSGDPDLIETPDVVVDHTNLPFAPINLAEGTRSPAVSLNVRTTLHRDGVDVEVPLLLDELRMDATPRRVQGFGLEEARLVLGPAASGAGVVIQLSADVGHLSQNEVRLSPDGTGTSTLRSYWFGSSTVMARSVPFRDASVSVDFVFPWLFLVVSLLGGAAGGLGAVLQSKDSKGGLRRVARGAVLGLIATVLYSVGVNVTGVSPSVSTGQAVVFGIAGLIGFVGSLKVPTAANIGAS